MNKDKIIECHKLIANTAPSQYTGKGLNFEIKKSSITVLTGIGDNGGNDWLKTLGGIYHPLDGEIIFFGENSLNYIQKDWNKLRKRIAYLTDDVTLLSMLNGLNNVILPGNYHHINEPEEVMKTANSLISQLNLEHTINLLPADIENTEQYLLCVIRALMLEPEVLFIENPFSSLGTKKTELLKKFLLNTLLEKNLTLVVSSQDIDFIKEYADTILFITLEKIMIFDSVYDLINSNNETVKNFNQTAKLI